MLKIDKDYCIRAGIHLYHIPCASDTFHGYVWPLPALKVAQINRRLSACLDCNVETSYEIIDKACFIMNIK